MLNDGEPAAAAAAAAGDANGELLAVLLGVPNDGTLAAIKRRKW